VIPTIITQILRRNKEMELGNLHPTRDLTFVKDIVSGFIAINKSKDLFGDVVNIGMNSEILSKI